MPASDLPQILSGIWVVLLDAGEPHRALPILQEVVENSEAIYGRTYALTLEYRRSYVAAVAAASAPDTALALAQELVVDCRGVLGADHLMTFEVRCQAATLTAKAGDGVSAAQLFAALHDVARVLGEDHWLADDMRHNLTAAASTTTDTPPSGH